MGPHPSKNNFYVEQDLTCNDIYMGALNDKFRCEEIKKKYNVCCSGTTNETQSPQRSKTPEPTGKYPICKLCMNGQAPKNKNTYIHSNFIKGTCGNLNDLGSKGGISDYICYPLQKYTEKVCGCEAPKDNITKEQDFCSWDES